MRVLICGGTGFLGRHIVNALALLDHDHTTAPREVITDVAHGTLDVAPVRLDRRRTDGARLDRAGLHIDAGTHHLAERVAQHLPAG